MRFARVGHNGTEQPAIVDSDGTVYGLSEITADIDPEFLRAGGPARAAVSYLIWYISQFMVLRPGDIINTGTPSGVALGRPDHPYLRRGDELALEIDGLGRQRQRCA